MRPTTAPGPAPTPAAVDADRLLVHNWRVSRLMSLGIPGSMAEIYADRTDWHQVARLVEGGCPAWLALRIVY
jgi:hypothetical protein